MKGISLILLSLALLLSLAPLQPAEADFGHSLKQFASHVESIFKHHHHGHHHHHKHHRADAEAATESGELATAITASLTSSNLQQYEDCNVTVFNTTNHILNVTISFIEEKCSNESLPEKAKKVCGFLTAHEEGVKGFLVGFFDLYLLSYFYAAGAGKCDIHPFNITAVNGDSFASLSGGSANILRSAGVFDGYASAIAKIGDTREWEIHSALLEDDDDWEHPTEEPHVIPADGDVMAIQKYKKHSHDDDDDDRPDERPDHHHGHDDEPDRPDKPRPDDRKRCERCYGKVVGKYIRTVLKIGKKICNETKCDYVKKVCDYLESHKEYTVGLIIGKLRPFKFAAGYCMGTRQCRPHRGPQPAPQPGEMHAHAVAHKQLGMTHGHAHKHGNSHRMMMKALMEMAQQFN